MTLFKQVTIVGLGLIGASLGLALKRRRLASRVVGVSRSSTTVRKATARGAIDAGTTDLQDAIREADLVVIATPVDAIAPTAQRLARFCRPGTILTDVGSTKHSIVRRLERSLPRHVAFIGSHPIAGSEQRGLDAAGARLFDGTTCILTRTSRTNPRVLARVSQLWQSVAGRVIVLTPEAHDRIFAGASHLPHLVAASLVETVDAASLPVTPRSLLEMTRIAQSDPDLWDDIFLSNRKPLLAAMDRFERAWRALRRPIARGDRAALRRRLTHSQSRRERLASR